jgi:hypothetical protein
MAGTVRIELDSAGIQELLTGSDVAADMKRRAEAVADRAGEGFEVAEYEARYGGSPRAVAVVRAGTTEARRAEATSKALTRAIDAGRQ